MSINSLLSIGNSGLFASQSAITTTGNNISNVNTVGYSRQSVRFEESLPLDRYPGQMGQGAYAAEVVRHFDRFLEEAYHDKYSLQKRWENQYEVLQSVESLFNEANTKGLNAAMTQFFKDWQDLSQRPNDKSTREALLSHTDSLMTLFHSTDSNLGRIQNEMDQYIAQEVDDANKLMQGIADLNKQINIHDDPGKNNANTLLDQRDQLVRKLSEIIDVDVINNGSGKFTVNTKSGHTLVDGTEVFELQFKGPQVEANLSPTSTGTMSFNGSDWHEYTMEFTSATQFRASLDGGKTWVKDPATGLDRVYTMPATANTALKVEGLDVSFSAASGASGFVAGDKFQVMPKSGLYWKEPTREPLNITPRTLANGTDDTSRVTAGRLAGYFSVRDQSVGRYRERLDALAKSMAWEVNRAHTQGAGLNKVSSTTGSTIVEVTNQPLGTPGARLAYGDKLMAGNFTMHFYDSNGQRLAGGPIDFDAVTAGIQNFDPATHDLTEVRDAINNTNFGFTPPLALPSSIASIQNGKLVLTAPAGYTMAFGNDTSGLLAGLGINNYFEGDSAGTINVRSDVRQDTNRINAGRINGGNEGNEGDNTTALAIAGLSSKKVSIALPGGTASSQSLIEYHSSLVSLVGAETAGSKVNAAYNKSLATDIDERQSAISGVNLDEEMSNLVKYQQSYKAAAKLITTADQMMQTLLGLKN